MKPGLTGNGVKAGDLPSHDLFSLKTGVLTAVVNFGADGKVSSNVAKESAISQNPAARQATALPL